MAETKSKDAIALLKADHRTVEELFAKFEKANGNGRKQQIAEEICIELTVHTMIEEEIFYPLRGQDRGRPAQGEPTSSTTAPRC